MRAKKSTVSTAKRIAKTKAAKATWKRAKIFAKNLSKFE
jgi:hypothetical protein